ncbi:hypothetical protein SHKM778_80690 [Streptomyces sp. KM77-8]|uniref:Pentapeptide repeat-containing protein n=1 Tax=Streptomyces haneummycinicus TaxID=3074435 RepID=A0AAT9HWB6_9ACTN
MGASLIDVDFRGSDLSGAVVQENSFKVTVDESTDFTGMSGTVFGPVQVIGREGRHEIGGAELEEWLRDRGADVRVREGRAPRSGPGYVSTPPLRVHGDGAASRGREPGPAEPVVLAVAVAASRGREPGPPARCF